MIKQLRVHHFVIIEDCDIDFESGLTVLTGETGAGKSLIIDALSLLLGKQGSDDYIKTGCDSAFIEAVFSLDSESEPLIIYRKFTRQKGSVIRVNNETVTLKKLKEITRSLIEIMGQHEHIRLFEPEHQLMLLDLYSGQEIQTLKSAYLNCYESFLAVKSRRDHFLNSAQDIESRLEFLNFQLKDIDQCQFKEGEENDLLNQKQSLKYLTQLSAELSSLNRHLLQANEGLSLAVKSMAKLAKIDPSYDPFSAQLSSLLEGVSDSTQTLESRQSQLGELDALDIDDVESRLDVMFRYKQKYKVQSIEDLIKLQHKLSRELQDLEALQKDDSALEKAYQEKRQRCIESARLLHEARIEKGAVFSERVQEKMTGLHFNYVQFECAMTFQPENLGPEGASSLIFMVSTNLGEPLKPLAKVASGGELSRIMLSIRTLLIGQQPVGTLIMDEVDTGVGGVTALKLGEYIRDVSKSVQVICITHLPQIAQFSDWHFVVSKEAHLKKTVTSVQLLSSRERQLELKRMLGGDETLRAIS